MTDVSFYHLTTTPLEKALPQLLLKVINSGNRAVLIASDEKSLEHIDAFLWSFSTKKVVPHGAESDGHFMEQPVYLTTREENPNEATILVTIGDVDAVYYNKFDKCLDVFDGNNDNEVAAARKRWKRYCGEECNTSYWKQGKGGAWEKADTKK